MAEGHAREDRRDQVTRNAAAWLRRRAENVTAAMLAVMFSAFLVQIVFRYLFNFPVGWTSELTVVMWLWLVLWGAAFVLKETDEIRFDLLSGMAGRRSAGAVDRQPGVPRREHRLRPVRHDGTGLPGRGGPIAGLVVHRRARGHCALVGASLG